MVWRRRFEVPVEDVWAAVSSVEGLRRWWLVPPRELDLRPGGAFRHHWDNVILELRENQFINFGTKSCNGMRFEMREREGITDFAFIDTWEKDVVPPEQGFGWEQPGGPGTPWARVAAGWHGCVDTLDAALTGKPREDLFEIRCRYYAEYLSDYYRWMGLVQADLRARAPESGDDESCASR